jgi:hypothetical protein
MGKLTEREDQWQREATSAAIAAARKIVTASDSGAINMNTPVGRLSDIEWGWIVCSILFAWIAKRAEQATAEGLDTERSIRMGMHEAWDNGAMASILPRLADVPGFDWSQSLNDWSTETMTRFLTSALELAREAMHARDFGGSSITRKPTPDELIGDAIPF